MMFTPRISTYSAVTNDGALNPFENIPNVASYGNTAADYHAYMLAYHSEMPVYNDFTRVHTQLLRLFMAKKEEWSVLYESMPYRGEHVSMQSLFTAESETITHSGIDSTTSGGTVTDSENTYDTATMKDIRKATSDNTGSMTHGHQIDTDRKRYPEGNPVAAAIKIVDYAEKYKLFDKIISDIVQYITCAIYIPHKPNEEE